MTNRVAQLLGVEKPIIQASMAYLTDAKLVAAVSNAGGFGILGSVAPGQDYYEADVAKNLALMQKEVQATKNLTDKPFGLAVSPRPVLKRQAITDATSGASQSEEKTKVSDIAKEVNKLKTDIAQAHHDYDTTQDPFTDGQIKIAQAEGIKVVLYSGTLIPAWIDKFHAAGLKVFFRPTTPYAPIIKDAVQAGADAIVVTGFDEGGTVPVNVVGTFAALPLAVQAVAGKVPVIAAGGIVDHTTAQAAFALGAEGLYVGTAFLASDESRLAANIKQAIIDYDAEEVLMFRAPNSYYRSLPGELPNKLVAMDRAGKSADEIWQAAGDYDALRQGMLFGDLSKGIASVGLGISLIHEIKSSQAIVDDLYAGIPENKR